MIYARKRKNRCRAALLALAMSGAGAAIYPAPAAAQSVSFVGTQSSIGGFAYTLGVAADGSGNVYVTDTSFNVYQVTPSGSYNTLNTGTSMPTGLAVDTNGNLYITDQNSGTVVKYNLSTGNTTTVASGFNVPLAVAVDASGNLFVANTFSNNVVKVSPGGTQTVLASGFNQPTGIAVDASDNVYVADQQYGRIVKIAANGAQSTVGSGYSDPSGVAVDANGNLYVSDQSSRQVVEVSPGGVQTALMTNLGNVLGVALDPKGDIFVADGDGDCVVKMMVGAPNFGNVNVCPSGQGSPSPCSNSLALVYNVSVAGTLGAPNVFTENAQNLDFSLTGNNCTGAVYAGWTCTFNVALASQFAGLRRGAIEITNSSGNVLATTYVYGTGTAPEAAFGPGVESTVASGLGQPGGIAVDGAGNMYVADAQLGVLKYSNGSYTQIANSPSQPTAVAVDAAGNLYVTSMSGTVTQLPSQTTLATGLSSPQGVAVDGAGNVYIANTENGQVIKVTPSGVQSDIGSGWIKPAAIAVDAAGDLFVADLDQSQIVEVTAAGSRINLGGNLQQPNGIAVDAAGDMFVSQLGNNQAIEIAAGGSQSVIFTAQGYTTGVAIDVSGDIFVAGSNRSVFELQRSQAPALTLLATGVGATSSAQSVTIQNIGNAQFDESSLSVGANFTQVAGSGNPADCASETQLNPGAMCNLSIAFTPASVGAVQGQAVLTNNNLNGNAATQTISLSGTAQQGSQTITFATIPTQTYGGSVSLSASASSGLAVSFASNTTGVCTVSGTTASMVGVGTCTIQASQAGSANYAAASTTQSFSVNQASQTVTFNAIPAQTVGSSVALSATATSGLAVSFASTTQSVCTVSGATASMVGPGTCTIQAAQAGNTDYAAAQTVIQSFSVAARVANFTITATPTSATIARGKTATFALELASVNGFDGRVKLSCSGGPTGSYCIDMPQTVKVNGITAVVSGIFFPADSKLGTYTITFTGTSGSLNMSATSTFTVVK
jgi:sugar lactone lactonase YvrE